jgi:nucleoside-diphosphate-sugar epimerase
MLYTHNNYKGTFGFFNSYLGHIAGKRLAISHVTGPTGVRGRNSDNRLILEKLGWVPTRPLREGLEKTYPWIEKQVLQSAEVK